MAIALTIIKSSGTLRRSRAILAIRVRRSSRIRRKPARKRTSYCQLPHLLVTSTSTTRFVFNQRRPSYSTCREATRGVRDITEDDLDKGQQPGLEPHQNDKHRVEGKPAIATCIACPRRELMPLASALLRPYMSSSPSRQGFQSSNICNMKAGCAHRDAEWLDARLCELYACIPGVNIRKQPAPLESTKTQSNFKRKIEHKEALDQNDGSMRL